MKDKDIISKGPKKRDPTCFQVQHELVIPFGTVLRQEPGKPGVFSCPAGYGNFTVTREDAEAHSELYKRVIA